MSNSARAPHRYRPVGSRRQRENLEPPVYSPAQTGCPAVEDAIERLYSGQNEETFWALIHSLNYAMQLETRVILPAQTAPTVHTKPAPWSSNPIPEQKAADIPLWRLYNDKGQRWLPVFTSAAAAVQSPATLNCPMVEKTLQNAMELALQSENIDGVVLNPWTRSATLDSALLTGLLKAARDMPDGEQELEAGRAAAAAQRWSEAVAYCESSAALGNAAALTLLGECCYYGRGRSRDRAQAMSLWRRAAKAGDINAILDLGDSCADVGAALRYYRRAAQLAASAPDIEYSPRAALRMVQAETRHISGRRAQAAKLCAEAAQGFKLLQREGWPDAAQWLAEAEALAGELAGGGKQAAYKKSLHLD